MAIGLFGLGELYYAFYTGLHVSGTGGIVQIRRDRAFWPELRDYVETTWALVLALVLGPLAEQSLRQTMTISQGSFGIFLDRPMSLAILGVTLAMLIGGILMRRGRLTG